MLLGSKSCYAWLVLASVCCCSLADYPGVTMLQLEESFRALDRWLRAKARNMDPDMANLMHYYPAAMEELKNKKNLEMKPALDLLNLLRQAEGKCNEQVLQAMNDFMNGTKVREPIWSPNSKFMFYNFAMRFVNDQCDQFFLSQHALLEPTNRPQELALTTHYEDTQGLPSAGHKLERAILSSEHYSPNIEDILKVAGDDPRCAEFSQPDPAKRYLDDVKELTPEESQKMQVLRSLFEQYLHKPCQTFENKVGTLFGAFSAYMEACRRFDRDLLDFLSELPHVFKLDLYQHSMCARIAEISEDGFQTLFERLYFLRRLQEPPAGTKEKPKDTPAHRSRALREYSFWNDFDSNDSDYDPDDD